jgi:DNA-binding PadR family transcriptional regulator
MSKKESIDEFCFKELGSLQEKILFHLAENPDKNAQEIQKDIDYPSSQYGNVNTTVKGLEKLGYIKSKGGKSKKNLEIKLYSCTENGVFYALAKNPKANIKSIITTYENEYPVFVPFLELYSVMGKERIAKFFENSLDLALIANKEGYDKAISSLLIKVLNEVRDLDKKTRKKFAKKTMKLFPKTHQMMIEWKKTLNYVLEE